PSRVLTRAAFRNAITLLNALGGSTNAVVHLLAIAGRLGVELTLDDFDEISGRTPIVADVQPSGSHLFHDVHRAGGIPAVLAELTPLLEDDVVTVTGSSLLESIGEAKATDLGVIRPLNDPIRETGAIGVVRGNLAPRGAIIKLSASSPHLLRHRGRAVVFSDVMDLARRVAEPRP